MPPTQRRAQAGLIDRLITQPCRFHFFQAVRLIELWLQRDAALHGKKLETVLRCKNSVALGFPPSQIEALAIDADTPEIATLPGAPISATMDRLRHIRLTPAFMGFLGVHGVLPYDYTATIAAQIAFEKNHAGRAFFDNFSHRMMVLFYRAWAACHIESGADADGRDRFLEAQLALAGRPRRPQTAPADKTTAVIPAEVLARYAALIRHRPMQGEMIAGVLTDFFRVPFRTEPLVGCWVDAGHDNRIVLGVQNHVLGFGNMLGPRYWCRDALVRLWVGPLTRIEFDRFLAGGSAGMALRAMLALFAIPAVAFEVRLILRAADVRPVALDNRARLGRASVVLTAPQVTDHADTRYLIAF
ncbi:type VI secretion system protein ImpH [Massilia sp. MP_M2]|uniref:type VI secretion system baseplate subunit TssG n=1 Tax=Massilia sp. MP_M2 TaxID=3071713 RepID=UPI00319E87BB